MWGGEGNAFDKKCSLKWMSNVHAFHPGENLFVVFKQDLSRNTNIGKIKALIRLREDSFFSFRNIKIM